ncbi:hypothetical protein TVAG_178440 [Trichomonas vaginalis G3]|uniref:Uncharacterized protein n=1 Tax=Trichomonas vaginalis (strain ATCC PRA-98 / G3) TaxID=412133 RepID=A2DIJ6_TRIV3|nr:hypothetical protein TVAGG3_0602430 [Trichomonas vaginalis G3]EAY19800.1 hypothetical protein TVAG_178440 [Trichomonas vaginalis G3]KAI5524004.1 hypothetical protein TVAGG3_0602430 [Trichomonas vaginalis G3]|eukprot:XP_001580786.1 hypothetical protein [Trichomonas vaginalis G3]
MLYVDLRKDSVQCAFCNKPMESGLIIENIKNQIDSIASKFEAMIKSLKCIPNNNVKDQLIKNIKQRWYIRKIQLIDGFQFTELNHYVEERFPDNLEADSELGDHILKNPDSYDLPHWHRVHIIFDASEDKLITYLKRPDTYH